MASLQTRRDALESFDGGVRHTVATARPDKLRFWTDRDWRATPTTIARGAGLSYVPASFGAEAVSVEHADYDRLIAFDQHSGELTVEAGANLWTCQRFLLRHGFYLPCHPGHGRITIGGCVAADVHGKNPWRNATFSGQVRRLTLLHPDHGILTLDRDNDPDVLALTCGGFGLTGHILTVTLATQALPSRTFTLARRHFPTAAAAFDDLQRAVKDADFAYSWHDLSPRRRDHFVFVATSNLPGSAADDTGIGEPPHLRAANERRIPVNLYNRISLPVLNAAYRMKTRRYRVGRSIDIMDALFPIHGSEIYFSLYGRTGFHEYQALVPTGHAPWFVDEVRRRAARRGVTVALCSAKAFGGDSAFIRFAGAGTAVAFNFPRGREATALMGDIDAMVVEIGGKPNIVKDSRLPAAVVRACYPQFDVFAAALHRFDPRRRFRSLLSERLQL